MRDDLKKLYHAFQALKELTTHLKDVPLEQLKALWSLIVKSKNHPESSAIPYDIAADAQQTSHNSTPLSTHIHHIIELGEKNTRLVLGILRHFISQHPTIGTAVLATKTALENEHADNSQYVKGFLKNNPKVREIIQDLSDEQKLIAVEKILATRPTQSTPSPSASQTKPSGPS